MIERMLIIHWDENGVERIVDLSGFSPEEEKKIMSVVVGKTSVTPTITNKKKHGKSDENVYLVKLLSLYTDAKIKELLDPETGDPDFARRLKNVGEKLN